MPRNKDKFEYFEVSILRESELYQLLKADAEKTAQSLAQIMLVRLADYYEGMSSQPSASQRRATPVKPQTEVTYHQETNIQPEDKKPQAKNQSTKNKKGPIFIPEDEAEQEEGELSLDFNHALQSAALFDKL